MINKALLFIDFRVALGSSPYHNSDHFQQASSSHSPFGSGYDSQLYQDANLRDEEQDGETTGTGDQSHKQLNDQPRHDLSNYLLNLRYANYANQYNQ